MTNRQRNEIHCLGPWLSLREKLQAKLVNGHHEFFLGAVGNNVSASAWWTGKRSHREKYITRTGELGSSFQPDFKEVVWAIETPWPTEEEQTVVSLEIIYEWAFSLAVKMPEFPVRIPESNSLSELLSLASYQGRAWDTVLKVLVTGFLPPLGMVWIVFLASSLGSGLALAFAGIWEVVN